MTGRIFLDANEYSVSEREPFVTITIKRDGDTSGAVTVTYATNVGTATAGSDYTSKSGTVTIPAGQNSVSLQIPIINDTLSEPTERFALSLINVDSGVLLFPRTTNVSILDDENPVTPPANPPQTTPFQVSHVDAVTGLTDPMQVQWINNNIALISEKAGVIKVADFSTGQVKSTLLDIRSKVNSDADRGLMDIELHPDLANNPYLYAYYVVDPADAGSGGFAGRDGQGNRYAHLVRYTLNLDGPTPTIVAGSEKIMLGTAGKTLSDISGGGLLDYTDPTHRNARASDVDANGNYKQDYIKVDSRSHAGGAIEFGPDGALYVSTGDGTSYNYADPRTASVQDVNSLSGKILRIDPMTGKGYADNPHATANLDANASKVWQMGLRNPYTMAFSEDGRLMISDTGWYSWEEINSGGKGANFGWPYFEGGDNGAINRTPEYRDLPGAPAFYTAVTNGSIVVTPAFRSFSHVNADPGHQMSAIVAGDAIYNGDKYPAVFKNDFFFADAIDGDIFAVDVNDRTQLQYIATVGQWHTVGFSLGPDGYVYYSDAMSGKIVRLVITDPSASTNRNPVVNAALADANGSQGVPVNYTVPTNAFTDPDGDALTLVATLANGQPLPSWLSFNATTRTFTGTPAAGNTGALDIMVTALDPKGGSIADVFRLAIAASTTNASPYVAGAIAHQNATTGTAFTHTLAAGTFVDPNGDALTLTATLANGQPLPSWLTFNAATRTFSGTPPTANTGTLLIAVTATDPSGAKATDVFSLTVATFNPAPILVDPLANQTGEAGDALSFTLPAGTFTDNGALTLSAKLGNGAALPSWLVFNPATGTFTGTPPANFDGRLVITVTATDAQGLTASDSFVLEIDPAAPNAPPTVANAIQDQSTAEEATFTFTVPANTFADADNDPLSLTATLANGAPLPSWLTFNAATRTFSGRPDDAQVGKISVLVTASDGKGGTVSDTFDITVTPVNDVPVVAAAFPDQTITEGTAFNFVVPKATFTDVDGDALTLTATQSNGAALPAWLVLNSTTWTFTGTAPAGSPDLAITLKADDGKGGSVTDTFNLVTSSVANVAPVVAKPIVNQTTAEEATFTFTLPADTFTDANNDTLTYSAKLANGAALPSWLTFNAATRTFSGRPDDAQVGTLSVVVTVSDGRGGTVSDAFDIVVTPVNDAPTVLAPIADQSATEGREYSFVVPTGTFGDVDGDTLTITATLNDGSALPSWLTFNATSRLFSGIPPAGTADLTVRVTASDGKGGMVSDSFVLTTPAGANRAPTVQTPIPDVTGTEQVAFTFKLPAGIFTDADGDTLTKTVTLENGQPLPSWLTYNAATETFTGMPDDPQVGTIAIRVTASDGKGGVVSDTFNLTIAPVNDAPVVANPIADATATTGSAFSFIVPANAFTDVDSPTLTYSATLASGAALPSWLTFNAATRTFSGTPADGSVGAVSVRVTATDSAGAKATDDFTITVSRPNSAETLYQNTTANQTIDAGDGRDVFVFNTTSSGYSWGPTQDGKGIVVWKGSSFDILFNFEELRFTNKSIEVSSILGSGTPDVLDDPDAVQHLTGTSTADRFIIDALSTDYRWGPTQDGKGVVVWRTAGDDTYDILTGFETLVFDDRTVDISGIGTV